jgi:hypothetical protein
MNFTFTDYLSYKAYTRDFGVRYNDAIKAIRLAKQAYKNQQREFSKVDVVTPREAIWRSEHPAHKDYWKASDMLNKSRPSYKLWEALDKLQVERAASRVESGKQREARLKITWNKNPLFTTIELDDHEKQIFWYKIKVKEMENYMFSAHFHLEEGQYYDLSRARKSLDPEFFLSAETDQEERSGLDKRVDELLEMYLNDFMGSHCGDCTCVPMSCTKCHGESILGIDTIKGISKHSLHKIEGAFGKNNERSINEAIAQLENYGEKLLEGPSKDDDPVWKKVGGWSAHVPRWTAEAKHAQEWLVNYRAEHLDI